jgi:hypothetical protein
MPKAAKTAVASSDDLSGLQRFERSQAKTPKGFKRLANAITRDAIGTPLTRRQRDEQRAQLPKLDPKEIDKNSYRAPAARQRSPRENEKSPQTWMDRLPFRPTPCDHGRIESSGHQ